MNTSFYPLTCPLCPHKLTFAGADGELLLYRCARHGTVILASDGRMWVDQLPDLSVLDVPRLQRNLGNWPR